MAVPILVSAKRGVAFRPAVAADRRDASGNLPAFLACASCCSVPQDVISTSSLLTDVAAREALGRASPRARYRCTAIPCCTDVHQHLATAGSTRRSHISGNSECWRPATAYSGGRHLRSSPIERSGNVMQRETKGLTSPCSYMHELVVAVLGGPLLRFLHQAAYRSPGLRRLQAGPAFVLFRPIQSSPSAGCNAST